MEGLTRLVSESMARHGFDRPLDYRRLHWSRWFRCESHHSLLFVPSKPGVFALAEEIMDLANGPEEPPVADSRPRLSSRAKLGQVCGGCFRVGPGLRPGQAERSSAGSRQHNYPRSPPHARRNPILRR